MRLASSLLFAALLPACHLGYGIVTDPDDKDGVGVGAITGRVCNPDGRSWLSDAQVYTNLIDDEGRLYDTEIVYTDLDGTYRLDDLPGNQDYTVFVQYGDVVLEEHDVYVPEGETVVIGEPDCFDPLELDVAVVTGEYDDFQLVLANMGFANYTLVDGQDSEELQDFLLDSDGLAQFDIIFFNGGHVEEGVIYGREAPDNAMRNLQEYVALGGQVYASDWAYDVVEQGWPEAIDFLGDDDEPDAAQQGEYGEVTAAVSDASMAEWLGSNYLDIQYDLPVWAPIANTSDAVSVHLTGSAQYRDGTASYTLSASPLLVSFSSGDGRVVYSTFRVAKNSSTDMMLALQYKMYEL